MPAGRKASNLQREVGTAELNSCKLLQQADIAEESKIDGGLRLLGSLVCFAGGLVATWNLPRRAWYFAMADGRMVGNKSFRELSTSEAFSTVCYVVVMTTNYDNNRLHGKNKYQGSSVGGAAHVHFIWLGTRQL
jgi:hypothetical protein